MRRVVEWLLIVAAALLVVGLIAYARGHKHHRGDEVGTHGTKIVVVTSSPDGRGSLDGCRERGAERARAPGVLAALRGADQDRAPVAARGAGDRARSQLGCRAAASSFVRTRPGTSSCACRRRAGRESAPVLVLQGHLDMVCERLPDSPYDPAEGRIALVRDGDWLTADGTTLGADNGIGIAAMMALAEDESLPHGPLELLMTVNEEIGGPGEGASGLDPSLVSGATLLNLDSEEDGKLTVGSASSTDTSIRVEKPREACDAGAVTLSVSVSGGLGGHSGIDIARGRANAIKVLGRALREALAVAPFRLVSLQGGKSWNAIPRDATAICSVPAEREAAFRAAVEAVRRGDRRRLRQHRSGRHRDRRGRGRRGGRLDGRGTRDLLDVVAVVPSGPLAMSPDFEGSSRRAPRSARRSPTGRRSRCTASRARPTPRRCRRFSPRSKPPLASPAARSRSGRPTPAGDPTSNRPSWRLAGRVYERLFGEPRSSRRCTPGWRRR